MGPHTTTVLIASFRKDGSSVRTFIGCEKEKGGSKDELLQNDSICCNTLSSNLSDLLEQIENRCEENAEAWLLDKRSTPNSKIGKNLKRELRNNVTVAWHQYDVADLWAVLKNYLRHLPSCPLGSVYYTEWSRMQWNYMDNQRIDGIRCLLDQLTPGDYILVKSIFRIFHRIVNSRSGCQPIDAEGSGGGGDCERSIELAARLGPYLLWERGQAPRHSTKEKVSLQTVWDRGLFHFSIKFG